MNKGVLPVLLVVLIALPGSFATCPSLSPLNNGNIAYSDPIAGSVYPFVTVANHTCDGGFQLTGGDELRVCLSDGTWSRDAPECHAMTSTCASLTPPPDGVITYASDTTPDFDPGTTATYSCSNGFGLSGGDTVRTCQGQPIGAWNGTEPNCEAITCIDIPDPLNGQIIYSDDTYSPFLNGTIASYSCFYDGENRIGYGLDGGNATRMCGGVGSSAFGDWDGTAPTCELIMCPILDAPLNGSVSFNRNFRRSASYSCDVSYGFSGGSRHRTCRGTDRSSIGDWDGSEPFCEFTTCGNELSSTVPSNGALTYSTNTTAPFDFGTTATYSCVLDGYQLVANPSVHTCAKVSDTSRGFWSPNRRFTPRCDYIWCSPISGIPSNVMVTYGPDTEADYVPGTVATLTCSGEGFGITSGNMQRTCGSGRRWSGTTITCEAILCPDIPNPANGRIDFAPDETAFFDYATTATYVCNVGFGISGANTTRICGGDGTSTTGVFSGIAPTCEEIMCLPLPVLANGQITYSNDTTANYDFTTEATYSCNADFSLVGDVVRTCGGDGSSDIGTWSLTEPTCESITCPSLLAIPDGLIIYSTSPLTSTNFEIRTTANYSCNVGFGITGGSGDRACGGDGSSVIGVWDGSAPTCEPIMCLDLVDPANGQINFSPDVSALFDFGTTATYTCDTWFGLVGEFTTRMCGGDGSSAVGEWSNIAPTCELILCSELTAPVNVHISYSPDTTGPEFDFGTTATFSCNAGFGLTGGGVSSTCEGDGSNTTGTWSVSVPTCEEIMCLPLPVLANGQITYSNDTTANYDFTTEATYSCNADFSLVGDVVRTCGGDGSSDIGTWSLTEPTCESRVELPFQQLGVTGIPTRSLLLIDDVPSEAVTVLGRGIPYLFTRNTTAVFISDNGLISFDQEFPSPPQSPGSEQFAAGSGPGDTTIIAPYWSDNDIRLSGQIRYEVYDSGATTAVDDKLNEISEFIRNETSTSFVGTWMLLTEWRDCHPFPHGDPTGNMGLINQMPSFFDLTNTYQAIIITDRDQQSYALFIYECDQIGWSGIEPVYARVGLSSGPNTFYLHPLSGNESVNGIDCLNNPQTSVVNILLDLNTFATVTVGVLSPSTTMTTSVPSSTSMFSTIQSTQTTSIAVTIQPTATSVATRRNPSITITPTLDPGSMMLPGPPVHEIVVPIIVLILVIIASLITLFICLFIFLKKNKMKQKVHQDETELVQVTSNTDTT